MTVGLRLTGEVERGQLAERNLLRDPFTLCTLCYNCCVRQKSQAIYWGKKRIGVWSALNLIRASFERRIFINPPPPWPHCTGRLMLMILMLNTWDLAQGCASFRLYFASCSCLKNRKTGANIVASAASVLRHHQSEVRAGLILSSHVKIRHNSAPWAGGLF